MSTLLDLWSGSSQKPFMAQSNSGDVVYIQSQIYNGWFFAKPAASRGTGYQTDGTGLILKDNEAIWTLL